MGGGNSWMMSSGLGSNNVHVNLVKWHEVKELLYRLDRK